MATNKTAVCKKGNWFEEQILEEKTGIRYYPDPKDRQASLLTKDRCIIHSDQINPKDYCSTTKKTVVVPQTHPEYIVAKRSTVGPRRAMMEATMKAAVEVEYKMKAASDLAETRKVLYATQNGDTYNRSGFRPALVENSRGGRVPTRSSDYSTEPAITYYTDRIANGTTLNFPITYTNSLRNPFFRSNAFSSDVKDTLARRCESNERPKAYPKLKDFRVLQALRRRLISNITLEDTSPGATVRCLIGYLLSVADYFRSDFAPVDDVAAGFLDSFSFTFSEDEKAALVTAYSPDDSSNISLPSFTNLLRGSLSPRQAELVSMVFAHLDRLSGAFGRVTQEVISAQFRPSIRAGDLASILSGLGFPTDNDGAAILEDFQDYYATVLATLNDDADAFEALLRSSWGV